MATSFNTLPIYFISWNHKILLVEEFERFVTWFLTSSMNIIFIWLKKINLYMRISWVYFLDDFYHYNQKIGTSEAFRIVSHVSNFKFIQIYPDFLNNFFLRIWFVKRVHQVASEEIFLVLRVYVWRILDDNFWFLWTTNIFY